MSMKSFFMLREHPLQGSIVHMSLQGDNTINSISRGYRRTVSCLSDAEGAIQHV